MTDTRSRESFPDHFQRESPELVNRLLPLSSSGFYLVGADMRHRGVAMRDLSPLVGRYYSENYRTVKTRIQHVFQKVDVPSRAVLSARVVSDLDAAASVF